MQYSFLHSALSCVRNRYQKSVVTVAPGALATSLLDYPRSNGHLRLVIVMACMLLLLPAIGGAATVLGPYSETSDNEIFQGYAPGLGIIDPAEVDNNVTLTFDFTATEGVYFTGAGTVTQYRKFSNLSISTTTLGGISFDPVDTTNDRLTFTIAPEPILTGNTETLTFSWDSVPVDSGAIFFEIVAFGAQVIEPPDPIPVPAAAWLFGSGLLGLVGVARRKNSAR